MSAYLVQILLPVADNAGDRFPKEIFQRIQAELAERYGGLTAYNRAPAKGVWRNQGRHQTDDIIVVEVMVDQLDEAWWRQFRHELEGLLRQETIVIRAQQIRTL